METAGLIRTDPSSWPLRRLVQVSGLPADGAGPYQQPKWHVEALLFSFPFTSAVLSNLFANTCRRAVALPLVQFPLFSLSAIIFLNEKRSNSQFGPQTTFRSSVSSMNFRK
jgi:hypothetical protein